MKNQQKYSQKTSKNEQKKDKNLQESNKNESPSIHLGQIYED